MPCNYSSRRDCKSGAASPFFPYNKSFPKHLLRIRFFPSKAFKEEKKPTLSSKENEVREKRKRREKLLLEGTRLEVALRDLDALIQALVFFLNKKKTKAHAVGTFRSLKT